jgi:DNA transposition AAA+ family ATPase
MEKQKTEIDEELYGKFFTIVGDPNEGKRISQAKAAQALGYSSGVISAYKNRSYTGNITEVEAKIRAWLKREERRVAKIEVPIADTATMTSMSKGLGIVQDEHDFGVFVGDAGTGKSTVCRQFIEDNHAGILLTADASFTKNVLVASIARAIGLDTKGGMTAVIGRIVEALQGEDTIVIIDEADYLSDSCLELLRQIVNDKAQTGVALVGLPRLKYKLQNLRNDHQQLTSRVGVFLEAKHLSRADSVKIIEGVWKDLPKDTIDAFVKAAAGSARTLVKLMGRVHQTMAVNNINTPDPDVIAAAGEMLMR